MKEILEKIEEIRKENIKHSQHVAWVLDNMKRYVERGNNETISNYEKGAKDAWMLIHKITNNIEDGGLSVDELMYLFGYNTAFAIIRNYTYEEIKNKIEEHEKFKSSKNVITENIKLTRGDIVCCYSDDLTTFEGVYLGGDNYNYQVLEKNKVLPKIISKRRWTVIKTGKHIDLEW